MSGVPGRPPREGARCWLGHQRSVAPLVAMALPDEAPFGFLGRVLPTGLSAGVRMEIHRLSRGRALELLERAGADAASEAGSARGGPADADRPEAERAAESARELSARIARREQELFRVGLLFAAAGPSPARAERIRAELARRLGALGFALRPPAYEVGPSLAPVSGSGEEPRPLGYWHTLPTDAVAAFFPFVDESVAEPDGVLVGLLLDDASPVYLDRWAHASHSWGLFGTTGAGKSFAAALVSLRSRWRHPELDLVVLDPLGEFAPLARALGGVVVELGGSGPGRLNPLDPATAGGDRTEKAGRVGALLRALFPSLKDEETAVLDAALHRLFSEGPELPTFSDLAGAVGRSGPDAGRLPALLRVLTDGSLAYLDGPTNVELSGSPLVLTFRGVPEDHLGFHLAYALDAVAGRVRDGRRRLVLVDEAHALAHHPATAEFLDRIVRTARHFRAGLLVLSQHPEDFLTSEPGRSVLRNLRATILLRLTSVSATVREFYQLTDAEAEWLPRARLPREAGYSEALLRFGPAHLPIAVVASTPEFELLARTLGGGDSSGDERVG